MHLYRHAPRRDEETWHLADDSEWVESVSRAASTGNGVLLYGDPGAGQDEFAWRIARHIASRSGLLELASPPDAASSASLAALAAAPPPPGRVLLIPDVDLFTGPELDIVVRLVRRHRAVVVAIASDPHGSPNAPLLQLVRLERARVRGLSAEAGMRYLENGFGGPLSDRAAHAVWDSGAGNRATMRLIADDWRESGFLVREDGVWVVRRATLPAGPRLARYWQHWLADQDPGVREVFEMLALSRELPLNVVLSVCAAGAVDTVHDLGHLRLRENTGREVSLRGLINTQTIADLVAPARSRMLLDRVTSYVDGQGIHRPAGLVAWRLRCGLPVKPERYIEGAEHLLTSSSPADALDMLKLVPPGVEHDRVQAARIAALLAAGQFVDLWTQVGNLRLAASHPTEGAGGGRGAGGNDVGPQAPAAHLIAASWGGDFQPLLRAAAVQPRLPETVSWLWLQAIHEALVITGRVREGLHADRELLHVLEQSGAAPFLVQRGRLGLFDLESTAGEWTRAAATLAGGWNAESGAPGQGKTGALYNAIAHVLGGQYEASTDILRREIPQLRAVGRHDLLPLAHSLQAISFVRTGNRAEALSALAAVELPHRDGGVWRLVWAATYFSAQAMGYLGRVDDAITRLMEFAERDHRLGNHAQEMLSLSAALQWGHEPALDLLDVAARQVDGRFAEACTWVVRGLRHRDPEELEYGVVLSRTLGQHFFADYAQQRLEALNGPCPLADAGIDSGQVAGRQEDGIDRVQALAELTPRQRTIVSHVLADKSNRDIARDIGVSVRTIESHLYQAYVKLNVRNRAELREAFSETVSTYSWTTTT